MKKILILGALLIFSCSDKVVEPEQIDTSVITPLAVNNNWKYEAGYYNTAGAEDSSKSLILFISKDTLIDTTTWYKIPGNSLDIFYQNRSNGLWIKEDSISERLGFLYPVNADTIYISGSTWISASSTMIPITTSSAGQFSCLKYTIVQAMDHSDSIICYLSPGFGLIRQDIYRFDNNRYYLAERWLLTSLLLY